MTFNVDEVRFGPDGLVPVVAQSHAGGEVLMVAWADRAALDASLRTGFMHYHSRSRGRLWKKGEESGHLQKVVSFQLDCDGDAVLALVDQTGPACHTGEATCFTHAGSVPAPVLARLGRLIEARKTASPSGSYTARLLGDANLRSKKVGEEATELVMALGSEGPDRVASEAADLLYHVLVACSAANVGHDRIMDELARRHK